MLPFEDPQPYLPKSCLFQSKPNLLDKNIELDALKKIILEKNNSEDNIIKLQAAPRNLSTKIDHFRWIKRTDNHYSSLYWPCAAHSSEHIAPNGYFWFAICGVRWSELSAVQVDQYKQPYQPIAFVILARTKLDNPKANLQLVMEHSWPGEQGWAYAQFLIYNARFAFKVRVNKLFSSTQKSTEDIEKKQINQEIQKNNQNQEVQDWLTALYVFDDQRFRRIATYREYFDARRSNLCSQYLSHVCIHRQLVKSQLSFPYEFKKNSQTMSGQVVETVTHLNGEHEQIAHDIWFNSQHWKYQARSDFRLYD